MLSDAERRFEYTESSIGTNPVKSVGDINPTTTRRYIDYYLLEITFHRLYRFTQIFKAYNIIYTDF